MISENKQLFQNNQEKTNQELEPSTEKLEKKEGWLTKIENYLKKLKGLKDKSQEDTVKALTMLNNADGPESSSPPEKIATIDEIKILDNKKTELLISAEKNLKKLKLPKHKPDHNFYQKRQEKRKSLESELPIDKQLEGSLGKTKWKFETPLHTLRNSTSPSDQYFIEKLKEYNKDSSLDSSFDILLKAKEKEENELLLNLQGESLIIKSLGDSDPSVRCATAQSLGTLAPVNPKLYIQLYEKGLSDMLWDVREETANSLGALASVDQELYIQLYEKGLTHDDKYVGKKTAKSLGALVSVNPELASRLYEKDFCDGTAESLGALVSVNPELASRLYEKGLSWDERTREETAKSLGALVSVNPELASQLYEKGLSDKSWYTRRGIALSLGALAPVNQELYIELYKKGISDSNLDVRREFALSLGALAPVNQELYIELYKKGISDNDKDISEATAQSLGALAPVNPELYIQLYEKGQIHNNYVVIKGTTESLGALAPVNPELASQLYERGINDIDWYHRRGAVLSLGALAPINPELYIQLYKKGINDSNSFIRKETAKSLGALALVNPELYIQLCKEGLNDRNSDVRVGTARSLKDYPFQKNSLIEKVTKVINNKTDASNSIFVNNLLNEAIEEKQPTQVWQYLEIFNKVKDHLEEKNKNLDAIKQIASVEKFFNDNQFELSSLAKMFNPKDFGVFLTNLSSNTLLYTKSFLEIAKPFYNQVEANKSLKNYLGQNSLDQAGIEKLLETGAQLIKSNKTEQFIEVIDKGINVQENLDKILLDAVAQEVGLDSSTLPSESLKRWNISYLAHLGSNNKIIEERIKGGESNYENVQELYQKIVEHGFIGDFKEFILDLNGSDAVGKNIALHNKNVFDKFKDLGIDPKTWYNYSETQDFLVSKEVKIDNTKNFQNILTERAKTVTSYLEQIKTELTPRQYEPLLHILQGAKNKGLADITNYEELKKQYQLLHERIVKIKEESFKNSREEYFGSLFEHLGHLKEAVELFQKEKLSGTETKEQGFRVKLWDRDPARDLFQGNYTHCCIALGVKDAPQEGGLHTHDPATVAQFMADAGMQVVEIYDQAGKDPIANTWLFVSKDRNGEPVLVLDNVEVNNKYKDVAVINAIRDNLFEFVKGYAQKCNIPKVGLGMVGTNDITLQSSNTIVVAPVDKVGGYLKDYTSTGGARPGRYYLEAFNHQTLAEIYNEEKDNSLKTEKKEKLFSGSVTVIDLQSASSESFDNTESSILSFAQRRNLSPEQLQSDLENIENSSFTDSDLVESPEEILATLTSPKSIGFIFMEGNKVVGYLSSLRADKFTPIVSHREYDASDKALYIESIAGKTNPYQTLQKLKDEAKKGGYEKIILHGINPRLNNALKRFGFETKATIKNWAGNKADYMELVLD